MARTALFQVFQGFHLGTDKREDGLLFVAEIYQCGILGCKFVDNGELQSVQVLNLIDLDPAIPAGRVGVLQEIVGHYEQIVIVKQVVLFFVGLVGACQQ